MKKTKINQGRVLDCFVFHQRHSITATSCPK